MADTPTITPQSLPQFFKEMLDHAMQAQHIELQEVTASYLVNLLHDFAHSEDFLMAQSQSLATLFLQANQSEQMGERVQLFRRIGDVALTTSGFFGDSLSRKIVDIDYYISMGGTAYASLSGLIRDPLFGQLYGEMAQKFCELVQLLSYMSAKRALTNNGDLLRVYERWLRTGDPHLQETLIEHGIHLYKGLPS